MRTSTITKLGFLLASALAWTGCVTSHSAEPPVDAGTDATVAIDAHAEMDAYVELACLAQGEHGCASTERPCCEGTYCQLGAYVLEYDTCVVRAEDGEACNYPSDCVSGVCDAGMCRMAACGDEGAECFAAVQCCAGFCPAEFTYGPSVCTLPLAAGMWCYSNAWCASGVCGTDGMCL